MCLLRGVFGNDYAEHAENSRVRVNSLCDLYIVPKIDISGRSGLSPDCHQTIFYILARSQPERLFITQGRKVLSQWCEHYFTPSLKQHRRLKLLSRPLTRVLHHAPRLLVRLAHDIRVFP